MTIAEEGRIKILSFFRADRVLLVLCCVAIVAKIVLATLSALSPDFLYLLQHLAVDWTKTSVPWVLLSGPFYEMWRALPFEHPSLYTWIAGTEPPSGPTVYLLVFMVKLPIFIADLLCAYLVKRIATELGGHRNGLLGATVWLLNPYVLLVGEMDGSFELISVTFLLAGILLLIRGRVNVGSVFFCLSIGLKLFPIVMTPALIVYYWRLKKARHVAKIAALAIIGLCIYVFWTSLSGIEFAHTLLFYTPFTTTISELIATPYASKIGLASISAIAFSFVLAFYWNVTEKKFFQVIFGYLLAYMAFSDWWPQYLLWLIPLMTVDLVVSRRWTKFYFVFLLVSAFLLDIIIFTFASNISAFYIPAFTKELESLSSLLTSIHNDTVMILAVTPILRAIFAGVALFYSAEICVRNSPRLRALFCPS